MISVREESAADAPAIEAVTIAAFRDAPHTSHTEQFIVSALRRAGQLAVSLVACEGAQIVGHVAVSPVSLTTGEAGWFGLGPVSVLPQRQRAGIGSRLIDEALRRLRTQRAGGCVVLGEPAYYGRFGFETDANLILPGVPAQYFQVVYFGAARPRGIVSYPAAFGTPGG